MEEGVRIINEQVKEKTAFLDRLISEVSHVIVGQKYMVERLLVGLISGGHILVEGVPGLAKTLAVSTLSKAVNGEFSRIQFTPDLLPADIVGTQIFNPREGTFSSRKGPVFANLVLADEVNRAPAKVQSALLEAMQEKQVTIGSETYALPELFLVMATQNPIEQEGTYPLPEAQMDRFMLKLKVGYPNRKEEMEILNRFTSNTSYDVQQVCSQEELLTLRQLMPDVYMDDRLKQYIVSLVFSTREPEEYGLGDMKSLIDFGASPRATLALAISARVYAMIRRRGYVTPEDIKAVAPDVLRHRVILSYEAEAENLNSDDIIRMVFDQVEVP
ncbi:MAG: ATPase [Acidobacteria bacterium]|nr:MAG: ATPase [Acidobacteriota bacterium]RLE20907.1 MAG: ATPase [Acidobacteriota bacterium]